MFLNHELLLTLLANDEIGKHINEIEKVLSDFYVAGVFDQMDIDKVIMEDTLEIIAGSLKKH